MKKLWTYHVTIAMDGETHRALDALAKARKVGRTKVAQDFVVEGLAGHYGADWRTQFEEDAT